MCPNCGKAVVWEKREGDFETYPYDDEGRISCVINPREPHPCGGTYVLEDYHQVPHP